MAKNIKAKKISIASFDKIMKETYTPVQTIEWNGKEITIKHTLPFKEMLVFVDSVTKSCFVSDTGTYLPEVKVFAIKCCVLEMYANFTLPSNVEHRYELVYNTDAFDVVLQHINIKQFNEIIDAISEKVENIAQANIENINTQMQEVYSAFDNLQKQFNSIFAGVNAEDISNFMGAISNSGLDETKLVKAYAEQGKAKDGE